MSFHRPYRDRREAGRKLASYLAPYAHRAGAIVLALPRGGVPVGYEIARALELPLDVFLVRKLGVPDQPELAFGAIAIGDVKVWNDGVLRRAGLGPEEIAAVVAQEEIELQRREVQYRRDRPPLNLAGRVAILVDDGLATGATMRAAVAAARLHGPRRLVVAVPVGAQQTCEELASEVDEFICPLIPNKFLAVGQWYADFPPTSDEEVQLCLERATHQPTVPTN